MPIISQSALHILMYKPIGSLVKGALPCQFHLRNNQRENHIARNDQGTHWKGNKYG
jgi:hypothetical protein